MSDIFRAAPDRWVTTGHGDVAVRSIGTGPDVLLIHGWPLSGATFRGLLPYLVPHHRCHVVDLVGAGDSRFDRSAALGITDHAASVRTVMDELDLVDAAVVGQDSGGLIARHALAGDPRVRSWGLIETEQMRAGLRLRMLPLAGRLPQPHRVVVPMLRSRWARRSRFVLGDVFQDSALLDGEFSEFFTAPLDTDADRAWAVGQFLRALDLDTLQALPDLHARISVPVRLIYSSTSTFFPLRRTRDMVGTFGGPTTLHLVDDGRLFVHEERPRAVAAHLLPVLER